MREVLIFAGVIAVWLYVAVNIALLIGRVLKGDF